MYFLEDKHNKYEYFVYTRCKGGMPYIGQKLTDVRDIYQWIEYTERRHSRYNQPFYIDNKFYKNIFPNDNFSYYYKILRRPIADLEEFYSLDEDFY